MTNGFYNTDILNTHAKRAKFIKDAIFLSYLTNVQSKYKYSATREIDMELSIQGVLDSKKYLEDGQLHCIDRNLYYQGQIKSSEYGEVVLANDWTFIYCFMNLSNLQKLIKKYSLKLINW